jgi:hypothetical protein
MKVFTGVPRYYLVIKMRKFKSQLRTVLYYRKPLAPWTNSIASFVKKNDIKVSNSRRRNLIFQLEVVPLNTRLRVILLLLNDS